MGFKEFKKRRMKLSRVICVWFWNTDGIGGKSVLKYLYKKFVL